jgi:tape measure domain-containing protein
VAEYTAGVVAVPVIPTFKGVHKAIGKELTGALGAAGVSAGDAAGKAIGASARRSTSKVGADVGTSIASGITGATAKVGDLVGRRIHSGIGSAIARTGESAGLRIGTGLESAVGSAMTRVESRGKAMGTRLYAGVRAPLMKIGGVSASVFGRFGLDAQTAAGLAGVAAIGMGVKFDAAMEQATQGFTTMLGSAQKAKTFLDGLQKFAASTPFEFPELVKASQRMIAFGFQAKDVIPTLTAIGDTAAGLGAGAEGVNQIVGAIGQMQAKGKIQSDELLQLTEVGVPALRILANQFGVSTSKMQEMVTDGVVPASKAIPLLLSGMEKGTKGAAGQTTAFAGLMKRQSTTLIGVWSNFVDVANKRLGQLVAPALPYVKTALSGLTGIMQNGLGGLVSNKSVGTAVAAIKSAAGSVRTFITGSVLPSLRNLRTALGPTFHDVAGLVSATLLPALRTFGGVLTGVVGPALRSVTGFLADHKVALEAILAGVAAGLAAYAALRAPMLIMTGIVRTIGIVTRAWAIAQGLLNIAMDANPIGLIVIAVAALVAGLVVAYKHSETFRGIVQAALGGVATAAKAVGAAAVWLWTNAIKPAFDAIVTAAGAVGAAASWLWTTVLHPVFSGIMLAAKILAAVITVAVVAPVLISLGLFKDAALGLWQYAIGPAFRGIGALALWLWHNAIQPAWHGIQAAISFAAAGARVALSGLQAGFRAAGSVASWLWRNVIVPVWHGIGAVIGAVVNATIKPTLAGLVAVFRNVIAPTFRWIYSNVIAPMWRAAGSVISAVWRTAIRPAFDALKSGVSAVQKAFSVGVSAIGRIWKGLESATRKPVQFVVDVVYNSGIRRVWNTVADLVHLPQLPAVKFARGGINEVLPGYTPGRDPHQFYSPTGGRIDMSGGEAIMRPEFTRAVGPGFVYGMNAIARKRGVAGVREALTGDLAYSRGGVMPGRAVQRFADGGILGALKKAGSLVIRGASSLLDAGASAFARKALNPILSRIPGADSTWAKAMYAMPARMINGFITFLKDHVDPKLGGDAHGVVAQAKRFIGIGDDRGPNNNLWTRMWGMPGAPWCAMFVSDMIRRAGAQKYYSGYPTALAAGYDSMRHVSHGQAGDLATYNGGGHINIIEKPAGGSSYWTIGGNQNALVQRGIRSPGVILRPSFAKGGILGREAQRLFRYEAPRQIDAHEMNTPMVRLMRALPAGQMGNVTRAIIRQNLAVTNAGVYDDGGIIPPGLNLVANASRRPEALLNDAQWAALTRAAASSDAVTHTTYNLMQRDITITQLEALQRRQEALARVGRAH